MGEDAIFISIFSGFQWVALLLAVITYKKYKNTPEKVFLYFLIYAVIFTEFTALVLAFFNIQSYHIYNTYILVSTSIYHFWFYKIIPAQKNWVLFSQVIFLAVYFYMFSYGTFLTDTWTQPIIVGSISVLIFSGIYFIQLLGQDEELKVFSSQRFWIVIGLFIFNLGIVPVLYFQNKTGIAPVVYNSIIMILIIILYGCFIVSFLSLYRKKN